MLNKEPFPSESLPMRVLNRLGMESTAWSLRRLHCPVSSDALVLEVGSGGNPYPRANVLLDAYGETRERHWAPLVTDRSFVFGFVERLPFKTGTFDFLIASHVLEHSTAPEKALAEFQRVARAGYIEVPDAFMERVNPYKDHRLEITLRNDTLQIYKKSDWIVDAQLVELYEDRAKLLLTTDLIPRRPFDFHVRYYWSGQIEYQIQNPKVDLSWAPPTDRTITVQKLSRPKVGQLRSYLVTLTRKLCSQTARNRQIDIVPLLHCPTCLSEKDLMRQEDGLKCGQCAVVYPMKKGVPVMYPQ
jgi:SAM-dependent methyltransferase